MADALEQKVAVRLAAGAEAAPIGVTIPAEKKPVFEAAQKAVELKNGQAALESIASEFKNAATWEKTAQEKIATERTASGEAQITPGTPEATRLNEVKKQVKTYVDLATFGYDSMPDIVGGQTKAQRQQELRNKMDSYVRGTPAMYDALKDAAGNIPVPVVEELLRDKVVIKQVIDNLNTLTDPAADETAAHKALMAKLEEQTKATAAVPEKRTAKNKTKTEKTAADTDKSKFDTDTTYDITDPAHPKSKATKLTELAANADVILLGQVQDELKAALKAHEAKGTPTTQKSVQDAQDEVRRLTGFAHVQEHARLQDESNKINARATKAEDAYKMAEAEYRKAQADVVRLDAEVAYQKAVKNLEAAGFALNVENGLANAMRDVVQTRAQEIIQKIPDYQKNAETTALEAQVLKLKVELDKRWVKKSKNLFGQEVIKPHKDRAVGDFKFLADNGVDATIDRMLTDASVPPEQKALLMNNKDIMDGYRKDLPAKILASCTQAGHNFTESEVRALATTSWFEGASEQWFKTNETVQKQLDKARENGVVKSFGKELLDKMGPAKYILLILLALGLVVGGPLIASGLGLGGTASAATGLGIAGAEVAGASAIAGYKGLDMS